MNRKHVTRWYGYSPRKVREDMSRCVAEVTYQTGNYSFNRSVPEQCKRKRGHGDFGLFCKQHAKTCVSDVA